MTSSSAAADAAVPLPGGAVARTGIGTDLTLGDDTPTPKLARVAAWHDASLANNAVQYAASHACNGALPS